SQSNRRVFRSTMCTLADAYASPASFSKVLMSLGVERIHTRTGNLYRVIEMR
ncbi:hypothetical protein DW683_06950, partial [Bacteroides sp. AM25-34]